MFDNDAILMHYKKISQFHVFKSIKKLVTVKACKLNFTAFENPQTSSTQLIQIKDRLFFKKCNE